MNKQSELNLPYAGTDGFDFRRPSELADTTTDIHYLTRVLQNKSNAFFYKYEVISGLLMQTYTSE